MIHFVSNSSTNDIDIRYEASNAYGERAHFANITWKDVIGSKLAYYMCPSYIKKIIVCQTGMG